MKRPFFLIWSIAFTVGSGALITAVLNIDSLQHALGTWIVVVTVLAAVVAIPISTTSTRALTE